MKNLPLIKLATIEGSSIWMISSNCVEVFKATSLSPVSLRPEATNENASSGFSGRPRPSGHSTESLKLTNSLTEQFETGMASVQNAIDLLECVEGPNSEEVWPAISELQNAMSTLEEFKSDLEERLASILD